MPNFAEISSDVQEKKPELFKISQTTYNEQLFIKSTDSVRKCMSTVKKAFLKSFNPKI